MSVRPTRVTRFDREKALVSLMQGLLADRFNRLGVSSDEVPMLDYDATSELCRNVYRRFVRDLSDMCPLIEITTERGYHLIAIKRCIPMKRVVGYIMMYQRPAEDRVKIMRFERKMRRLEEQGKLCRPLYQLRNWERDEWRIAIERQSYLNPEWFEGFYQWLREVYAFYVNNNCVDSLHAVISIQRGYTTLRISGKAGKPYDMFLSGLWWRGRVFRGTVQEVLRRIEEIGLKQPNVEEEIKRASVYLRLAKPETWRSIYLCVSAHALGWG